MFCFSAFFLHNYEVRLDSECPLALKTHVLFKNVPCKIYVRDNSVRCIDCTRVCIRCAYFHRYLLHRKVLEDLSSSVVDM